MPELLRGYSYVRISTLCHKKPGTHHYAS